MHPTTETREQVVPPVPANPARTLSTLYSARFAFAVLWATLLAATASSLSPFSATLLVLYPLVDLVAVAHDARRSAAHSGRTTLVVNGTLSLLAGVGLAVAATSTIPDVLRIWGAWAIVAGLAQLVVAVQRHRLGGQWPMILSGGISVLAGASFVAMASGDDPSLVGLAGYAALGGIFFGISALRLRRQPPGP